MKILILEDDPDQARHLARELHADLSAVETDTIATEYDFRQSLDGLVASPPDVVIIDLMLPWTRPVPGPLPTLPTGPEMSDAPGIRCARLLHDRLPSVPVIIHSVDGQEEVSGNPSRATWWVPKTYDSVHLVAMVRELTSRRHELGQAPPHSAG